MRRFTYGEHGDPFGALDLARHARGLDDDGDPDGQQRHALRHRGRARLHVLAQPGLGHPPRRGRRARTRASSSSAPARGDLRTSRRNVRAVASIRLVEWSDQSRLRLVSCPSSAASSGDARRGRRDGAARRPVFAGGRRGDRRQGRAVRREAAVAAAASGSKGLLRGLDARAGSASGDRSSSVKPEKRLALLESWRQRRSDPPADAARAGEPAQDRALR